MANGSVEGLVGYARRNFMVPVPRFPSWEAFNASLEEQCRKRQGDVLRGHTETIGARLARDLEVMAELPPAPFDACDQASGRVNSQALVRYKSSSVKKSIRGIDFSEERLFRAGRLRPSRCLAARLCRRGGDRLRRRSHRSPSAQL
jgi:hypothetical protein